jgi:hypothetical protein
MIFSYGKLAFSHVIFNEALNGDVLMWLLVPVGAF